MNTIRANQRNILFAFRNIIFASQLPKLSEITKVEMGSFFSGDFYINPKDHRVYFGTRDENIDSLEIGTLVGDVEDGIIQTYTNGCQSFFKDLLIEFGWPKDRVECDFSGLIYPITDNL